MIIKVTLNQKDEFEGVIIEHLKGKKNRSGTIKKMLYDHILLTQRHQIQPALSVSEKPVREKDRDSEINSKLEKLTKF